MMAETPFGVMDEKIKPGSKKLRTPDQKKLTKDQKQIEQ